MPLTQAEFSLAFAGKRDEFLFYLNSLIQRGLITCKPNVVPTQARLTIEGWSAVRQFEQPRGDNDQCFIAMSFSPILEAAWREGFEPGVTDAGYRAFRVDQREHNDKICDVIVAEIRKSHFLVADCTQHKPGVYFEAGLAMGLALPVIWSCHEDDLNGAHFDTRQYSHVVWKEPVDLRNKVKNRIEATVGLFDNSGANAKSRLLL